MWFACEESKPVVVVAGAAAPPPQRGDDKYSYNKVIKMALTTAEGKSITYKYERVGIPSV